MISDERQRAVSGEFLRQHPEFPQTSDTARLLADRVRGLVEENGEDAFGVTMLKRAYLQLMQSGALQQSEYMPLDKFEALDTPDMEKYLKSKGMI